jgi:hypothetical protein
MLQDRPDLATSGVYAEDTISGKDDSHDRQPFGQASPKVGQAPDHQKDTWYIALV